MNNPWYYKIDGELIKKRKPCMPGDSVHVTLKKGTYRVTNVTINGFTVKANHKEPFNCKWNELICIQGQGTSTEAMLRRLIKEMNNTIDISQEHLSRLEKLLR